MVTNLDVNRRRVHRACPFHVLVAHCLQSADDDFRIVGEGLADEVHGAVGEGRRRTGRAEVVALDLTDERWKAIERVGWGASPDPRPSLCEDCDRRFVTDAPSLACRAQASTAESGPARARRPVEAGSPASVDDATGPDCQWRLPG